jgi:uncharacterized protein (DUF58 family)
MSSRPSPRFVALVAAGIVPAVLALVSDVALGFAVAFDLCLVVALLVDAAQCAAPSDLTAERTVRAHLSKGKTEPVVVRLRSAKTARAIILDEAPQQLLPRGVTSHPRATRLIAGGVAEIEYPIAPRARGRFSFGVVNVIADGPLGLARRRIVLAACGTSNVAVYPNVGEVDRGALDPGLMMAELGIKRVRRRDEGTELESLRDAVLDDELRRIDWRATARRGKLTAKSYELERNHDVLLCLDTGRLMGALFGDPAGDTTKLDHAIGTALRLAAVALNAGDRVGLMTFAAEAGAFLRPDKGRSQIGRLMESLVDVAPASHDSSYVQALGEIRRRQKKRALVVFLTDFIDLDASATLIDVLGVLARKHAILFIALRDPHIREVADRAITDLSGAYRSLAALGLERSRAEVVEHLSARGVRALDLPPSAVTAGAIRAYLALRAGEGG